MKKLSLLCFALTALICFGSLTACTSADSEKKSDVTSVDTTQKSEESAKAESSDTMSECSESEVPNEETSQVTPATEESAKLSFGGNAVAQTEAEAELAKLKSTAGDFDISVKVTLVGDFSKTDEGIYWDRVISGEIAYDNRSEARNKKKEARKSYYDTLFEENTSLFDGLKYEKITHLENTADVCITFSPENIDAETLYNLTLSDKIEKIAVEVNIDYGQVIHP